MKPRVLLFLLVAALAAGRLSGQSPEPAGPPPAAALRARLMDLGGALSNEGFNLRDRAWTGRLEPGRPQRLAVNLFGGNQYWFCAAVDPESTDPRVSVFGPDGRPIGAVSHGETGLAAAGVTAEVTGQYFVQVETAGGPATDFCLLYFFK